MAFFPSFQVIVSLIVICLASPIYIVIIAALLVARLWKDPSTFFETRKRGVSSEIIEEQWGESKYIVANGINFHYVTKGDGPLMLCLHGFPEFWYSWRFQLKHFQKDYKVVAVDLRGYNKSDKPKNVSDYSLPTLLSDVEALITALGYTKCVLLTHDWGSAIGWNFARYRPDMLEKLVILSIPEQRAWGFRDLIGVSYIAFFQLPYLPEYIFSLADYHILRYMYKSATEGNPYTDKDIEAYITCLAQPNCLFGALCYYRNFLSTKPWTPAMRTARRKYRKIPVPTLIIQGEDDKLFDISVFTKSLKYCEDATLILMPGASHWILQQQPEKLNNHIESYLK